MAPGPGICSLPSFDWQVFARPERWRKVCERELGSSSSELYVWEGVADDADKFVCIGHVCTTRNRCPSPEVEAKFRLVNREVRETL